MYKNKEGENYYTFGWLEAQPGSNHFSPTSGGNSTWAKTKREAIRKVNGERKEWEKKNPTYVKLRVNETTIRRCKSVEESMGWDRAMWSLWN